MFITRKHISRRTLLRGVGVTVALPLLDSMVPAQTPLSKTAARPASRLGAIYIPHGSIMDKWTPAKEGAAFEFSDILSPLSKYRDRTTIVTNLAHPLAGGVGSDAGGDHARSAAVFLTGSHPDKGRTHVGVSVDQVAAQHIGQDTPLPSIELALEEVGLNCGGGYGCAYYNTISWRTPTLPMPMENSPQVVFERLFGDGSTTEQRRSRKQEDSSILDSVTAKVAHLQQDLPAGDRTRLSEYLDGIREIERRIQQASKQSGSDKDIPDAPVGIPESFDEHVKLMFDLQALAYQANITRVATMMFARDGSGTSYPLSGNRGGFHGSSHHSNVRANMDNYALINKYHVSCLAYLIDKLQKTPDGDGTLLDHTMILYGSSMSNSNQHDHDPLPVVLLGGGSGQVKGGRHIVAPPHTPMSNLLLGMLDKLGVHQDSFGDSTGKIEI